MGNIREESKQPYSIEKTNQLTDDEILEKAAIIARSRVLRSSFSVSSSSEACGYFKTIFQAEEREVFSVASLDAKNNIISVDTIALGTISSAVIHPRELVKVVLKNNAASVILVHNHPSGSLEPSDADHSLTKNIINTLSMIEVEVLDHIIVSYAGYKSFSENGWI